MIVGIGQYPKASKWPLLNADKDALKFHNELKFNGFLDRNTRLLTNNEASSQNIQVALKRLYDNAEPEDQVVIYLGGHSQQITDISGDEMDGLDEAFVCYNAGMAPDEEDPNGKGQLLDDDLKRWVIKIADKITRYGSLFVFYDGAISAQFPKNAKGIRGPAGPFLLANKGLSTKIHEKESFDNEWLDFQFTENFSQVVSLNVEPSSNCFYQESDKPQAISSPLLKGFLSALNQGKSLRFRDLEPYLRREWPKSQCPFKLDGALQSEVFKLNKERKNDLKLETTQPTKGKIFSLVIGVSKYQNVDPLNYGHIDAELFFKILQTAFGKRLIPENQFLFLDSMATIKPIIMAMEKINAQIGEGDQLYFFFAGHGDVENLISRKAHLLLYNSPSHVYKAGGTLPMEDVKDYFNQWLYKKARVFLVIDACKSGKLAGGKEGKEATMESLKESESQSARLLSCQPNELSLESPDFGGGHGAFSYFLEKGLSGKANLDGDSLINIMEISRFLRDSVAMATENAQNPVVDGNRSLAFFPVLEGIEKKASPEPEGKVAQIQLSSNPKEDSLKAKWMKELAAHIAARRFIEPAERSGKASLERIQNTFPQDKTLIDRARHEFQNGIDLKSQQLINEYIKGNEKYTNEELFATAAREIDYLLSQLDVGNQLYFMYLSRKYFFEGRSIKPRLVDNDLNRFKLKEAIQNLKTSLKYEPEGAQNYNAIGRLREANRQFEDAIANYKKASALAPSWKFPINNLGSAFQKLAMEQKDKRLIDSAIAYFEKATQLDPKFVGAHKNLGKAYLLVGKRELAKKQYQKAIFGNPGYAEAYHNLGDLFREEQKWDSAQLYLQMGMNIQPQNPDLLTNMGNVFFDQIAQRPEEKEFLSQEAMGFYQKALFFDPFCKDALQGKANAFWETQIYDSAAIFYHQAIQLDSSNSLLKNYWIEALTRSGDLMLAEKEARKLSVLEPENGLNWFDWGIIALLQKNEVLAEIRFKKAIQAGFSDKSDFEAEPALADFRKTAKYKSLEKSLK